MVVLELLSLNIRIYYLLVIVFDNRGIGESTVASYFEPITIELMAQDTIELVKHLGIKRFNLFGGSMGGRIALCVAFEHSIRS